MFQWFAGVSLLALAATSNAQVIFSDDFEAGVSTSVWTGQATLFTVDATRNQSPSGGVNSAHATSSAFRMSHPVTFTGSTSAKITYWFYDGNIAAGEKQMSGAFTWLGGTWGAGGAGELVMVGKYNGTPDWTFSGVADAVNQGKYQARFTPPGGAQDATVGGTGYCTLVGAANRAVGWHKVEVVRGFNDDSTATVTFMIDGQVGRAFTNSQSAWGNTPWNFAVIGLNSGTTGDDYNVDGYSLLNGQPYVSTQPLDTTVVQGQPLTLTANAIGNATLTYQWKKGGVNIPGATDLAYNIAVTQLTNSGNYTFVVSNSLDVVTSRVAVVTIQPLIQILNPPQSTRVNLGETATFSVTASGNGTLQYQWKKSGVNIPGATDSVFNIPNAAITNRGSYTVYVTNDVHDPGITSSAATLQVNTAPLVFSGSTNMVLSAVPLEFAVPINDDYSTNGVPFETFESYSNGQTKMFNAPSFSGTTTNFIDLTATQFTRVTNSYPSGHAGTNVLKSTWSWAPGGSWLRYTTAGTGASFSPVISTNLTLHFDMYTAKDILMAFMIRETNPTGALGSSNGGSTGPLEELKVDAGSPPHAASSGDYATVFGGAWRKIDFSIPTEIANFTVISFSGGNGKIDSTTGKVVLESLIFNPIDSSTPETIYIDNFTIVPADPVTFTLDSGPAGATIDPVTGKISWLPPGLGVYNFTVSAKDTGSFITPDSGLTGTGSFTVTIVNPTPASPKLNYSYAKPNVTFTWSDSSFALESASNVTGPWTPITGATTGFTTNTASASVKFFRLKF
jgi:hypothetical protein